MGQKEVEFEVERHREDRPPVKKVEPAKRDEKKDKQASDIGPAESENWLESPRMVENMKYFVYAQSFVLFLTFGLPKVQDAWKLIMELLFK